MRRVAEVSNKRDLLEKGRGWTDALDWFLEARPSPAEVREALEETGKWNPTDLRGRLYKHGRVEALEWLLGDRGRGGSE